MYRIYHTEGFVLGHAAFGESNKYLYIFTRELGLVGATAQGVRELHSKLRYNLQDLSYAAVDLVRGRDVWRLTNAENPHHRFAGVRGTQEKQAMLARIANLLKRLLGGEEPNEFLFYEMYTMLEMLDREALDARELFLVEMVIVARTLNALGYWGSNVPHHELLAGGVWNKEMLYRSAWVQDQTRRLINEALKASQL